jgi:hypothetical protein
MFDADMSITPFLRSRVFDPDLIETMSEAFRQVRSTLGLSKRVDPITEVIAKHIIEAAQRGVRTKTGLYLSAIREFRANPQWSGFLPGDGRDRRLSSTDGRLTRERNDVGRGLHAEVGSDAQASSK